MNSRAGAITVLIVAIGVWFGGNSPAFSATLQAMYDAATPGGDYDKDIVLETGVTYTGGLWIGGTFNRITAIFETHEEDVRVVGSGAIIDLRGGEICIGYCNGRLDIEDCVIINGNVRFRGYDDAILSLIPTGSVRYVTFYNPHDYGIRMYGCGDGILLERNLIVNAVDTGDDFQYLNGNPMEWLPTGASFAMSLTGGDLEIYENWSFHTDPATNADPLRHFALM